jgi:hypothetical protein
MSNERIAALLAETASGVRTPQLADAAWADAARVRRRRRRRNGVLAGLVAVAVAVGVGAAVPRLTGGGGPGAGAASPAPSRSDGVDTPLQPFRSKPRPSIPDVIMDDRLAGAQALSERGVAQASMLYEPRTEEGGTRPHPVYAFDGAWVRLDVVNLRFVLDSDGNQSPPLTATSLSPDGRLAAFPQPDEVVVVDLADAEVIRISIPGFNEHILWQTAAQMIVGSDSALHTVQLSTRTVRPLAPKIPASRIVVDPDQRDSLLELPISASELRSWRVDSTAPSGSMRIDPAGAGSYTVVAWQGRAWRHGDLVASAGFADSDGGGVNVVAVVDTGTGAVVRLLSLAEVCLIGVCEPVGWLDKQTVVLRTEAMGLRAWDVATGEFTVLTDPFPGVVSLAVR